MDNENQHENNRKSEPEQNSSQENIPLWLQGLDNSESDDKGGASNEEQPEGTWTKELNDKPTENAQEDKQPEKILPDWLSTLSDVESEMPKIKDVQKADESNILPEENKSETEISDADEPTEKVEIKNSQSEDVSGPVDAPVKENFNDEGFIEISEMDLTEKPKPDQLALDEDLSEAEELPYWLKDMIVEHPGDSYSNKTMTYAEIVALSKEDTKPIKVSDETDVTEEEIGEDQISEAEPSEADLVEVELAGKPVGTSEKEQPSNIEEHEESEESVQSNAIASEPIASEPIEDEVPDLSLEDDTKPVRPHPVTTDIEDVSGSETDQPVPVDEESVITDEPLDSSQVQEESEDLIEIDQDQWIEKDALDQVAITDSKVPDQWLEEESVEEEADSQTPSEWPDQEPEIQETELKAPDQWLEEEPSEQESEPQGTVYWQEEQQVEEEAEPAIGFEQEHPPAVEAHLDGEETEEIKVKESDQAPEGVIEQEEIEQPTGLDQAQPEGVPETEPELALTQKPEALPEVVEGAPEEAEQPGGTPKSLRFAKYLLDQGDFDRAKEIFKPFIEKNEFLDDIEAWLNEASNNGAKTHSGTWELIGDIAMAQSHPNRAFEAYKQAITVLLSTKKEINETD